jgi:hypothetical protein
MTFAGKCPKCDAALSRVLINAIDVEGAKGVSLRGISYACPHCQVILSVAIDPVSLKSDTINGVTAALRQRDLQRGLEP